MKTWTCKCDGVQEPDVDYCSRCGDFAKIELLKPIEEFLSWFNQKSLNGKNVLNQCDKFEAELYSRAYRALESLKKS